MKVKGILFFFTLLLLALSLPACVSPGKVRSLKGDVPPGSGDIARAIEKDEEEAKRIFFAAEDVYAGGEEEKAYDLYASYVRTFPESPFADDAYLRMGEIKYKQDDFDGAAINFQKIVETYIGSDFLIEAKYRLALAQYQKGEYSAVIQSLESMLLVSIEKERKISFMTTIADSYINLEKYNEGLSWYVKAVELSPEKEGEEKIEKRIINVVDKKIDPQVLPHLLPDYAGTFTGEYIKYALIIGKVDEARYEEAKEEMKAFIDETEFESMKLRGEDALQLIAQRMDVKANTIGCILPLSGRFAPYGQKMLQGVQLAAGIFSSESGVPVNLVIKDSKGEPELASDLIDELVDEDKVIAIVGLLLSKVAEEGAERAQERGVPIMTLSQKNDIPHIGNYVFRNFLTNRLQARTLADYAVNEMGLRNFAIMYPRDFYGEEMMSLFWNYVLLYGGTVVGIEDYDRKQYDFGWEIKRLIGMDKVDKKAQEELEDNEKTLPVIDFEAVFIPDSYDKAAAIAPQFVYNDVNDLRYLGPNSWNSGKLIERGGKYIEGAVFTEGFYADSAYKRASRFASDFESLFSERPGTLAAQAYDATRMLVTFIKNGEARSRVEMRDSILNLDNFMGVTGRTTMLDSGDAEKKLFVLTVKNKKIVEAGLPDWLENQPEPEEGTMPLLQ
ncbi:MAG: penicillin-binding protein activator [Deltaproteobacteria bacterium]|nr:penicillin-binding protein activator [Deltaproteobacteria bacterium]